MTIAQDMLTKYLAAEADILSGKTVQFGGRTLTFENLADIRAGRQEWERRVASESSPRGASMGGLSYSVARFDGGER